MTHIFRNLVSGLFLFIVISGLGANSLIFAQTGATTASITGNVTDEQNAVIPGATIVSKNLQTRFIRETRTAEDGSFSINQLPPGSYELTVEAAGFTTKTAHIDLVLGTTALLNFPMQIGANSDIIEVKADNLVGEDKTESSTNNGKNRIDNLPINMRNFLDFSLTSPRVTQDRTPQQGVAATSGISFNGLPARNNNITIDGLDNNDLTVGGVRSTFSQDAVLEFQVVSDSYSAEFGRALGGVVNIVTKGGGNDYHGSVFSFNRNNSIAARNPFSTINPEFKQYQFGATLEGPIKKDKAFVFTSFERATVKQNSVVSITDDTLSSITRQGFVVRNGPVPFGVGNTTFLVRADARLSANDTFYFRYNYGGKFSGAGEPFGELITGSRVADTNAGVLLLRDNAVAASNTYISTKLRLVNETRFLYSRRDQNLTPIDKGGPQVNLVAPEGLVVFGRGTLLPQLRKIRTNEFLDNVSLTRGRHDIKFGADFTYNPTPLFRVPIFPGGFAVFAPIDFAASMGDPSFPAFTGLQAFDPTLRTAAQRAFLTNLAIKFANEVPGFPKGLPLADLALPSTFGQGFLANNSKATGFSTTIFSAFFQDNIKLSPSFLLKLGVRYDISRNRLISPNNGNFSPRIAFSYRPSRLPHLNIHAGYGLFFSSFVNGTSTVAAESSQGDLKIPIIPFPNSILFYNLPGHHLPEGPVVPAGVPFIPQLSLGFTSQPGQRASYSQQINLSFDYLLGNNTQISLSYDFVRGIKIYSQRDINPIVRPIPGDPLTSAITGRLDPTTGQLLEFSAAYDSYYHGLTVSINRRFSNNFSLIANYTFSKDIDNFIDFRNELLQSVDPLNPRGERGLSLQDVRSRFVFSGVWELNYTKNPFLRDFKVSTIINLESGRPFNLLAGTDLNGNGDNPPGDRPFENGGSIARNLGLTPGFAKVDMRLTRSFSFKEHINFQVFIEAFNLFNRVNISDVNPIYPPDSQGNFNLPPKNGSRFIATPDRYRAAFPPRQLQFGFRVAF